MRARERVVLDTNTLIGRLLLPNSVPGQAVRKVVDEAQLLVSESTLDELTNVLARPKFDSYITVNERQNFLRLFGHIAELIPIVQTVQICRDPKDDKFLELAINGEAALIVTGDNDLLALHPFRGVSIFNSAAYLRKV